MTVKTSSISFLLLFLSSLTAKANDQQFLYKAEADLFYTDKLINPTASFRPALQGKQESKRSLGLTKSQFSLNWVHAQKTSLHLTLRPDFQLYDKANQYEFDSRTGSVYRLPSTLELLDAYHYEINAGESFSFAIGTFLHMAPLMQAYDPILEFGLNTRLQRKFAGLKISWRVNSPNFPQAQPNYTLGNRFSLFVFQGDNDRNYQFEQSESTYDTAPTSRDPHKGLALEYLWRPSTSFETSATLGFRNDTSDTGDRSNNLIARVYWSNKRELFGKPVTFVHDLRYNRVRFDLTNVNARSLNQFSTSLTGAVWIKDQVAVFSGLHLGSSERHLETTAEKASTYDGWQIDIGVKRIVNEVLIGNLIAVLENRALDIEGTTIGGFGSGEDSKKRIARFAFQLGYRLGGP